MNAVHHMIERIPREAARRLAGRSLASDEAERQRARARFGGDLAGFVNRLRRAELDALAAELELPTDGAVGVLRQRLWMWGARREGQGAPCELLGTRVQPIPHLLRGKLVHFRAEPAVVAPASRWPRPIPEAVPMPGGGGEPDTLEELLDRAQRLVGVRLGTRDGDKEAFGTRIAALLRVGEDGHSEPDWRGEVEIKTVPVVRDGGGLWWVKEDPAVSMETARPLAKLARVLWVARVADEDDSPILAWIYQERGPGVMRLIRRDLHTRPKGGAGATTRGWYLHKRFFADNGLMAALNGDARVA